MTINASVLRQATTGQDNTRVNGCVNVWQIPCGFEPAAIQQLIDFRILGMKKHDRFLERPQAP
jgi:hypothetical protein